MQRANHALSVGAVFANEGTNIIDELAAGNSSLVYLSAGNVQLWASGLARVSGSTRHLEMMWKFLKAKPDKVSG